MRLTSKAIENIIELLQNEYISLAKFTSKKLLNSFIESNGVCKTNDSPKMILLKNKSVIFNVLKRYGYSVNSQEDLEKILNKNDNANKIDNLDYYEHTKVKNSKSFEGLMLSSFDDIDIIIDGTTTLFKNTQCGTGVFFHSSMSIEIPSDVVLVGVENPQVVWFIERYKYLFDNNQKYIFFSISEYKTSYQYKWLKSFQGEYIHFGDFDLAGISIYLNTIVPKLQSCKSHSFLIPHNIYKIINKKQYTKDFSNQQKFLNIKSNNPAIKELISFIKDKKITLEQEALKK